MPEPLSIVTASVALVQGCMKALVLIGKATSYDMKVHDAQMRTELTCHSLTTWAQAAGLFDDPPTLLVNANDAPLVPKILERLRSLFDDIIKGLKSYGNHLESTEEELVDPEDGRLITAEVINNRQKWYAKVDIRPIFRKFQPFNRLRWIAFDEEKFDGLLKTAKEYIANLEHYLESSRREKLDEMREFDLRQAILHADWHRSAIIGEATSSIVGQASSGDSKLAIAAAARLKHTRLSFEFGEASSLLDAAQSMSLSTQAPTTVSDPVRTMRLSSKNLKLPNSDNGRSMRTIAKYAGDTTLVEFKYVKDMNDSAIQARVGQVAALLHDAGAILNSLECRGYIADKMNRRYGYIFSLPAPTAGNVIQISSLRMVLGSVTLPSLNKRLEIALTLFNTLLNLHTSGWLHKQIRSDNVVLMRNTSEETSESTDDLSEYSIHVAGYVYSRLDDPEQQTESIRPDSEADLYCHPLLLSDTHQSYNKAFDIFSVGCTVLEIGLWKPLRQILQEHASEPKVKSELDPRKDSKEVALRQEGLAPIRKTAGLKVLKKNLLCCYTQDATSLASGQDVAAAENALMRSLESAMGRKYMAVVRKLLAARPQTTTASADEHKSALQLELLARDAVQAILHAI